MAEPTCRAGLVVETSLGHGTHAAALARWVARDRRLEARWLPVPYRSGRVAGGLGASLQDALRRRTGPVDRLLDRLPLLRGNWSLRAGLRGRRAAQAGLRGGDLDVLLFHTQVTALCSLDLMRRTPAVVSLDATPLNMDGVAAGYDHLPGTADPLDALKRRWNRAAFAAATALAPWSRWAAQSLVHDYGVEPGRVHVIPPGVDLESWSPGNAARREGAGPVRLLFVGGQFARKGGWELLQVFRAALADRCTLDIVTRDPTVSSGPGVRVHRGLTAGDERLRRLYASADLLVHPTRGDCMPLAVIEAMASGTAVVASRMGAIPEQVRPGENGVLVRPDDAADLSAALRALVSDPVRLRAMGAAGRRRAEERFDAARNYPALIGLLVEAGRGRSLAHAAPAPLATRRAS